MNRLRLFKSMIKREILRGILLTLITVSGTLAMVAVPERPVDKSLAVYDEKISTSEDVSRQGTPPSSGRQSPLAVRTESQDNVLANVPESTAKKPEAPIVRPFDPKAPHPLGALTVAGPTYTGRFIKSITDQKLLSPIKTIRTADGRLEYAKVTDEIRRNRNQFLVVKSTGKVLSSIPKICVTPAEPLSPINDLASQSPKTSPRKDYAGTLETVNPKNAFECIQYFYAKMERFFSEFASFTPNQRIAWAAYAVSMLRIHEQTQLYESIARQVDGSWRSKGIGLYGESAETAALANVYKTIYSSSADFRKMVHTSRVFLAEAFRYFYEDCMLKNNITFDMLSDYLRQFPVAQEILACSSAPQAPLGFFERQHGKHHRHNVGMVFEDKQGFLTDFID